MRAVLIAAGNWPGIAPLNERYPAPLLPLVDRPFLQHVVEFLISQGVKRFDLILSHLPEKIEHFLGDGKRWGVQFTFHLARDEARPYRHLKMMSFEPGETILLGHADRLPSFAVPAAQDASTTAPLLVHWQNPSAGQRQWTGWAILNENQVAQLPTDADEEQLRQHLLAAAGNDPGLETKQLLSVLTYSDLLAAHAAVLHKQFDGLLVSGWEADPGVWLSRNIMLHPTARIFPPVYINEDCRIGAGVKLGPDAVIGHGCVLDARCTITNSVIFTGSYVGEALELEDVIVDKNRLVNARFGSAVTITDNFILGNLAENHLRRLITRLLSRLIALAFLVPAAPILLLTALCLKLLRTGPVLHTRSVIHLPAASEEISWRDYELWSFVAPDTERCPLGSLRDFLLRFLPQLVNIVRGDLSFVGVTPRNRKEIEQLSHDWRQLYLGTKGGIVTEAFIRFGAEPTEDDLYAAETYYAAEAGWSHDLRLLTRYWLRVFLGFLRSE